MIAAVFLANLAAAGFGYASYLSAHDVAAAWPPTGLLLSALLSSSRARWPFVLGAGVAAQFIVEQLFGCRAWCGPC